MKEVKATENRLVAVLAFLFVLCAIAVPAAASDRTATLHMKQEFACFMPTGTSHMTMVDTVDLKLPEINGPVEGYGRVELSSKGMPGAVTATSFIQGELKNDEVLILTNGYTKWPPPEPSTDYWGPEQGDPPTRLPFEPGATAEETFDRSYPEGVRCAGTIFYRLEFERQQQTWDVDLRGWRALEHIRSYPAFDPSRQERVLVEHSFGFTFRYRLGVRVEVVKRKGKWEFEAATVTRAEAKAEYEQSPELYRTISAACTTCDRITALVSKSLNGSIDEEGLNLGWPNIRPLAEVTSVFAYQCAVGPEQARCERERNETSSYQVQDTDFFSRAQEHKLPLAEGTTTVEVSDPGAVNFRKSVVHQYVLRKLN